MGDKIWQDSYNKISFSNQPSSAIYNCSIYDVYSRLPSFFIGAVA